MFVMFFFLVTRSDAYPASIYLESVFLNQLGKVYKSMILCYVVMCIVHALMLNYSSVL